MVEISEEQRKTLTNMVEEILPEAKKIAAFENFPDYDEYFEVGRGT